MIIKKERITKEKVNPKEKEKEKKVKEKEMVKHTRPMAVKHSLPPNKDRGRRPLKIKINNNIMKEIGPKIIGGVTPPRTNKVGAKTLSGPHIWPHHTGAKPVTGHQSRSVEILHIFILHSPSLIQSVSCPGWNPGIPSTCAKILFT